MPHKHYIVCSQSASVDQDTNAISLFHVLDGFDVFLGVTKPPEGMRGDPLEAIRIRCVAVWMRLPDESPKEVFDYQLIVEAPGEPEIIISEGEFTFPKAFHRFQAGITRSKPWTVGGMVKFIAQIRKHKVGEWDRQEFWIPIQVHVGTESISEESQSP